MMFGRSGFVLLSACFVFLEHPGTIARGMEDAVATRLDIKIVWCDTTYWCPDGNTCCNLPFGAYSCCPFPYAVCCSDGLHCCPPGNTCIGDRCYKAGETIKAIKSIVSQSLDVSNVLCDATHYCPDGTTCCKLTSGGYGCCPLPNAVCCSDGIHCCPEGYTCNGNMCSKEGDVMTAVNKIASQDVNNVLCDATHYCPDGTTCCKLASGEYGCCPAPNAVCCSDGVHCCPHGYTCNVDRCSKVRDVIKAANIIASQDVKDVWCDPTHTCPDGNTCCIRWPSWGFSCCPIADAVCCVDGEHCCAQGYTCYRDRCYKAGDSIKAIKSIISQYISDVFCDATHYCPDGSTCCKLASGEYGCCPVPNAVCCSDGIHCCPHGYTCNGNMCSQEGDIIKAVTKIASQVVKKVWCDATHYCLDGNTCCYRWPFGGYGCCPIPNAVCCADGVNCCAQGYTCFRDMCYKAGETKKAVKIIASQDVPCDATHYCPEGTTCCSLPSSGYGCCPLPNAVCCSDGIHCCPHGYTCNVNMCSKEEDVMKAVNKIASLDKPAKVPRKLVAEPPTILDEM